MRVLFLPRARSVMRGTYFAPFGFSFVDLKMGVKIVPLSRVFMKEKKKDLVPTKA